MNLRWIFGLFAGLILVIFIAYPQARLMYLRGNHWQGNYAIFEVDEMAYAAYLQSLIDGHPRRNDPFTRTYHTPDTPLPESLFSVQFASAYAVAIPARILGLSAGWALMVTGVLSAFLTGLVVFWLIGMITNDSRYALVSCLSVFCFGALAGGFGAILGIFDLGYPRPFFAGFRRYLPAVPFPFFFGFFAMLWLLAKEQQKRLRIIYWVFAFLMFGFMVFSYFFVWTAAISGLICITGLWIVIRPDGWESCFKYYLALCSACLMWLIPYGILLSNRSQTTDAVQILESTRVPDLTRVSELVGFSALILLAIGIKSGRIQLKERSTVYCAAMALIPFIVHNQQIFTGRSLQPVHYDLFTANYLSVLAFMLSTWCLLKRFFSSKSPAAQTVLSCATLMIIGWGVIEAHICTRVTDWINRERDKAFWVGNRLKEISKNESGPRGAIMSFASWPGHDLPTTAPQPVLWALHQTAFGGISREESREHFYQYLFYQNISESDLKANIRDGDFAPIIALFGFERFNKSLTSNFQPLKDEEIMEEAARYGNYTSNFYPRTLSYVVVRENKGADLSNIDKWYDRKILGTHDDYTLYEVTLK